MTIVKKRVLCSLVLGVMFASGYFLLNTGFYVLSFVVYALSYAFVFGVAFPVFGVWG